MAKVIDTLRPQEWLFVTSHAGNVASATTTVHTAIAEQVQKTASMSASPQQVPLIPESADEMDVDAPQSSRQVITATTPQ